MDMRFLHMNMGCWQPYCLILFQIILGWIALDAVNMAFLPLVNPTNTVAEISTNCSQCTQVCMEPFSTDDFALQVQGNSTQRCGTCV